MNLPSPKSNNITSVPYGNGTTSNHNYLTGAGNWANINKQPTFGLNQSPDNFQISFMNNNTTVTINIPNTELPKLGMLVSKFLNDNDIPNDLTLSVDGIKKVNFD